MNDEYGPEEDEDEDEDEDDIESDEEPFDPMGPIDEEECPSENYPDPDY
jgi:hypothetical protein